MDSNTEIKLTEEEQRRDFDDFIHFLRNHDMHAIEELFFGKNSAVRHPRTYKSLYTILNIGLNTILTSFGKDESNPSSDDGIDKNKLIRFYFQLYYRINRYIDEKEATRIWEQYECNQSQKFAIISEYTLNNRHSNTRTHAGFREHKIEVENVKRNLREKYGINAKNDVNESLNKADSLKANKLPKRINPLNKDLIACIESQRADKKQKQNTPDNNNNNNNDNDNNANNDSKNKNHKQKQKGKKKLKLRFKKRERDSIKTDSDDSDDSGHDINNNNNNDEIEIVLTDSECSYNSDDEVDGCACLPSITKMIFGKKKNKNKNKNDKNNNNKTTKRKKKNSDANSDYNIVVFNTSVQRLKDGSS